MLLLTPGASARQQLSIDLVRVLISVVSLKTLLFTTKTG